MTTPGRAERTDLLVLAATAALVPAVWWALLGFRGNALVLGVDGPAAFFPWFREYLRAGAVDARVLYRPQLAGGMALYETIGVTPLQRLAAALGLSAIGSLDFCVMGGQVLHGFLGARAAADLARRWRGEAVQDGAAARVAASVLIGFTPAIAARVGLGHLNLLAGFLFFVAILAVAAAAAVNRVTMTLLAASVLAVASALTCTGQQAVVVSALFGAPLFAVVAFPRGVTAREAGRSVAWCAAALVLGLGFALPEVAAMLGHARSTDAARTAGDLVIYELGALPATALARSIPWASGVLDNQPPWADANFALGPLLLLVALAPHREARRVALAFVAGAFAAAVLAIRVEPLASAIVRVVPVLGAFRVPARCLEPFTLVAPILGCAGVMSSQAETLRGRFVAYAAVVAIAFALFPAAAREAFGWTCAVLVVAWGIARSQDPLPLPAAILVLAFAPIELRAFAERLPAFATRDDLETAPAAGGLHARAALPRLASPLVRAHLQGVREPLTYDEGFVMGLSTVEGYLYPQRRFVALVSALRGVPFQPTLNYFRVDAGGSDAPVLRALYDVRADLSFEGAVSEADSGLGEAWFSPNVEPVESFDTLAKAANARLGTGASLRETALVVMTDEAAANVGPLLGRASAGCSTARVLDVEALDDGQRFRARVDDVRGTCLLTLPTNYAERFRARATREGGAADDAPTLPVYGALLGVLVPPGAREIEIRFTSPVPPAARLGPRLACVGLLALMIARGRRRRIDASQKN